MKFEDTARIAVVFLALAAMLPAYASAAAASAETCCGIPGDTCVINTACGWEPDVSSGEGRSLVKINAEVNLTGDLSINLMEELGKIEITSSGKITTNGFNVDLRAREVVVNAPLENTRRGKIKLVSKKSLSISNEIKASDTVSGSSIHLESTEENLTISARITATGKDGGKGGSGSSGSVGRSGSITIVHGGSGTGGEGGTGSSGLKGDSGSSITLKAKKNLTINKNISTVGGAGGEGGEGGLGGKGGESCSIGIGVNDNGDAGDSGAGGTGGEGGDGGAIELSAGEKVVVAGTIKSEGGPGGRGGDGSYGNDGYNCGALITFGGDGSRGGDGGDGGAGGQGGDGGEITVSGDEIDLSSAKIHSLGGRGGDGGAGGRGGDGGDPQRGVLSIASSGSDGGKGGDGGVGGTGGEGKKIKVLPGIGFYPVIQQTGEAIASKGGAGGNGGSGASGGARTCGCCFSLFGACAKCDCGSDGANGAGGNAGTGGDSSQITLEHCLYSLPATCSATKNNNFVAEDIPVVGGTKIVLMQGGSAGSAGSGPAGGGGSGKRGKDRNLWWYDADGDGINDREQPKKGDACVAEPAFGKQIGEAGGYNRIVGYSTPGSNFCHACRRPGAQGSQFNKSFEYAEATFGDYRKKCVCPACKPQEEDKNYLAGSPPSGGWPYVLAGAWTPWAGVLELPEPVLAPLDVEEGGTVTITGIAKRYSINCTDTLPSSETPPAWAVKLPGNKYADPEWDCPHDASPIELKILNTLRGSVEKAKVFTNKSGGYSYSFKAEDAAEYVVTAKAKFKGVQKTNTSSITPRCPANNCKIAKRHCVLHGTPDPKSPQCRYCDAPKDARAWTTRENGWPCNDGLLCSKGDQCTNGECLAADFEACKQDSELPTKPAKTYNQTWVLETYNLQCSGDVCAYVVFNQLGRLSPGTPDKFTAFSVSQCKPGAPCYADNLKLHFTVFIKPRGIVPEDAVFNISTNNNSALKFVKYQNVGPTEFEGNVMTIPVEELPGGFKKTFVVEAEPSATQAIVQDVVVRINYGASTWQSPKFDVVAGAMECRRAALFNETTKEFTIPASVVRAYYSTNKPWADACLLFENCDKAGWVVGGPAGIYKAEEQNINETGTKVLVYNFTQSAHGKSFNTPFGCHAEEASFTIAVVEDNAAPAAAIGELPAENSVFAPGAEVYAVGSANDPSLSSEAPGSGLDRVQVQVENASGVVVTEWQDAIITACTTASECDWEFVWTVPENAAAGDYVVKARAWDKVLNVQTTGIPSRTIEVVTEIGITLPT